MKKINKITTEEKILKRLKNLASLIRKHNKLYHQKDKPEINDKHFDELVKENYELEKKFPHLILENSPNKFVGGHTSKKFKKIIHKLPMLSLENAFNNNKTASVVSRFLREIPEPSKISNWSKGIFNSLFRYSRIAIFPFFKEVGAPYRFKPMLNKS